MLKYVFQLGEIHHLMEAYVAVIEEGVFVDPCARNIASRPEDSTYLQFRPVASTAVSFLT
jgi:hypothetical protein